MTVILAVNFLCALAAAVVLNQRRRAGTGFLLGLVAGPVGLLIAVLMRHFGPRLCPHCHEWMHRRARVCPHCTRVVVAG